MTMLTGVPYFASATLSADRWTQRSGMNKRDLRYPSPCLAKKNTLIESLGPPFKSNASILNAKFCQCPILESSKPNRSGNWGDG